MTEQPEIVVENYPPAKCALEEHTIRVTKWVCPNAACRKTCQSADAKLIQSLANGGSPVIECPACRKWYHVQKPLVIEAAQPQFNAPRLVRR